MTPKLSTSRVLLEALIKKMQAQADYAHAHNAHTWAHELDLQIVERKATLKQMELDEQKKKGG